MATFLAKLIFALTFAVPVLLMDLRSAIFVSIIWGLFLLAVISIMIAMWRKESILRMVAEHWSIAGVVIIVTYYIGLFIAKTSGKLSI